MGFRRSSKENHIDRADRYRPLSMTEIAARLVRPIRRLGTLSVVAICLFFALALAASALVVRAYTLRDSVLPGVRVAGVDVGGLSREDARSRIETSLAASLSRPVTISVEHNSFTVRPDSVFSLDGAATERLAYESARGSFLDQVGALAAPFALGKDVDPVLLVRPSGSADLSHQLLVRTQRPVPASIEMHGRNPVVTPGRAGTGVDEQELLALLRTAAFGGPARIDAPVSSVAPPISTAAARQAATSARTAVAAPVLVQFKGKELGELPALRIARLLRFKPVGGTFELHLDRAGLEHRVGPLLRPYTRKPRDASFRVDGKRVRVVKARDGTTLDAAAAEQAILGAAVGPGLREAPLALAPLEPKLTTAEAKALGIRRQVSTFTTEMGASSSNRIWNVHLMARYIDGTIIKPGQVFSFNKVVGPRTPERGFVEGQMIFGSLLLPAIGGGVCQTATTLFNSAFELGLPVLERHNHSWYISHYPIGRDATVSWGGPDLKFRNNLDHAILIKTSYTDSTLTFSFYSTPQGRKVVSSTGPETNFRSPQPSYALDPSAPPGSTRTVGGSHAQGFDITVFRKVYEHGKLIRKDSFTSHYVAVGDTVIYGPGGHPPRIDFVLPSV
jgi:vancomycin resistance protein YoaR